MAISWLFALTTSWGCGDNAPAPAAGCDPEREACTFSRALPKVAVGPGEERDFECLSWTLSNPTPLWVTRVDFESDGAYHHSNWFFVPEDTYPPSDDRVVPCGELGFDALRLPAHARLIANSHVLNVGDGAVETAIRLRLSTIPPQSVTEALAPFRMEYNDLDIPAQALSRFTSTCDLASEFARAVGKPLDIRIAYVMPHVHQLATGFHVRLAGGPRDGELIYDSGGYTKDDWGRTYDPPLSLGAGPGGAGATGLTFGCDYDNPRAANVTWGIGDQEMCVPRARRPSVIWLHFQECTGCTESLLRAEHPTVEKLILELISLDYHETLAAAAGHQVEAARRAAMSENRGKYLLVVEGALPVKDGGIYCKIGGKTAIELLRECGADAAATIAIGSCASWGGMPSTSPNPTGASSVASVLGRPVLNIPGCPPNPYNFLSTVVHYLTFGELPALDDKGRPTFAYGRLIHENCERRAHFDAGRFALEFGDEGHRKGYCLYKLGCKGPETWANCPQILFGDAGTGTWPVGCGHPCIGCTEQGIGFAKPIHALADLKSVTPPMQFARPEEEQGRGPSVAAVATVAAVTGLAIGAGARIAKNLGARDAADLGDRDPPAKG
jgi:hydrogenase small subunit